ncbi:MAG: DNA repair protein RecO [Candidatus Sungbacteria bacterium GWC2_49_10]|uniref:DNA repair protein RecO n=2 Tax=Parcubacteria group TaxID=1794811 RepID=A0A0G1WPY3_9BACT|nr:MAG: repair protein RecO protein [Parcubacteria group bacterium GW2011_GWB1_50_9]KKW20918.1 MAG: repair protein RecO protein [Candidatus Adlerbacteria bacterium GW2011_GWC1_50_9]OGZ92981.1 MAG: DNA repair protein RecO [Candidatus Sungbacteria bacterium GWC2_49_10]
MHFTDAIVLSRIDVGEADAVFSLYTKEYGKVRARAQGVKKENAKLRGHLETLALSHIGFVATKNGERLIYAEASATWPCIRADFERLRAAMYFVSLVDSATFAGEPDPDVWSHLQRAFAALEEQGFEKESFKAFEEGLVRHLGYGGAGDISILGLSIARPV